MSSRSSYRILCIPLEGEIRCLNVDNFQTFVLKHRFTGLTMGYSIKTASNFNHLYEYVDGIPQNRYAVFDTDDQVSYDGYYELSLTMLRRSVREGEHLNYREE